MRIHSLLTWKLFSIHTSVRPALLIRRCSPAAGGWTIRLLCNTCLEYWEKRSRSRSKWSHSSFFQRVWPTHAGLVLRWGSTLWLLMTGFAAPNTKDICLDSIKRDVFRWLTIQSLMFPQHILIVIRDFFNWKIPIGEYSWFFKSWKEITLWWKETLIEFDWDTDGDNESFRLVKLFELENYMIQRN